MPAQVQMVDEAVTRYATVSDYYRIFAEEMESLYFLAFLLTADSHKAEQCFVSGLGECVDRIDVFMERARTWARRAVVKHAIRMIRPVPEGDANGFFVSAKRPATAAITRNPFTAIVSLPVFERFVFVMSVLEGQSDEDCQDFLRCSRQEVVLAREVAFWLVAAANPGWERIQVGSYSWQALLD
jgi:hypothetical protein